MDAKALVDEIVELDQQIAELRDRFEGLPTEQRTATLAELFARSLGDTGPDSPVPLALVRATDLVFGLEDAAAGILAPALDHPNSDVRHLAGEALIGLAEDGVQLIVPAVDHALGSEGSAAEEMPFILALVEDAEAPRQIERFLAHEQADPVAAAIEALADVCDPSSVEALERLIEDQRTVSLDGGEDAASEITIGALAGEAIDMIEMDSEEQP
jgi:HEAT repeat protein